MRIVEQNSEEDLVRYRAVADLGFALRDLAANIMRVTRGAGKPSEIGRQCVEVVNLMQNYRDRLGLYPSSDEISNGLSLRDLDEQRGRPQGPEYYAYEEIMRGALQLAASRLLSQSTQEAAGVRQINEGIRRREQAFAKSRADYASRSRTPAAVRLEMARRAEQMAKPSKGRTRKKD